MDERLKSLCIVDRFEGEWAVLEWEGQRTFDFPRSLLPITVQEGDVLRFSVSVDDEETQRRKEEMKQLTQNLFVDE